MGEEKRSVWGVIIWKGTYAYICVEDPAFGIRMFKLIELHQIALLLKCQLQSQLITTTMLPSPIAEMLERNRYVRLSS